LPEWRLGPVDTTPGMDEAEVETFTDMVRAFLIHPPAHPLTIFVGWTANDYQIDVATPAGQDEYKRLLDRAAGLGAGYVLFAPSNSAQSLRAVVGVAAGDGGVEAARAGDRDRRPPGVPELWPVELAGGKLSASHVHRRAAGELRAVSRSLVRPRVGGPRAVHRVPLPAVRVRAERDRAGLYRASDLARGRQWRHAERADAGSRCGVDAV